MSRTLSPPSSLGGHTYKEDMCLFYAATTITVGDGILTPFIFEASKPKDGA